MNKMSAFVIGIALVISLAMTVVFCGEEKPAEPTYAETLVEAYVTQEFGPGSYYVETWYEDPETGGMSFDVYENGSFFRRYDGYTIAQLRVMLE